MVIVSESFHTRKFPCLQLGFAVVSKPTLRVERLSSSNRQVPKTLVSLSLRRRRALVFSESNGNRYRTGDRYKYRADAHARGPVGLGESWL